MKSPKCEPLSYDPRGVFIDEYGLKPRDVSDLAGRLEAARAEVLADLELWRSGGRVPEVKVPLDAGFIDLPERLLAEYDRDRSGSQVGRILAASRRFVDTVDRVVILGIGGSYMGARALFEACCHPYHNELGCLFRGNLPQIYFEGNNVDNDAAQALIDLLVPHKVVGGEDRHWGIVVVSKSGGTLETAVALRTFLVAMRRAAGGDLSDAGQRVIPVTGASGRLFELAKALGCQDIFEIPDGVGGRFSIFTAVGLLPAALMGLDIVALLRGAAAMTEVFRKAPPGKNPVLDYVGVCHLMETLRGAHIRVLSVWRKGLEAAGLWYDQLLSESLGKAEKGATPLTVVNTRDLHSRGQQHQEGRRDKLITNVIVDQVRRGPLAVGESDLNQDRLNDLAEKTLPDIMAAAIQGTNQAYAEDGRPTADLHLPMLDEPSLGQLFQMLMLSTVAEGRLIGINPYGQPGVEGYKKHMNAILRGAK